MKLVDSAKIKDAGARNHYPTSQEYKTPSKLWEKDENKQAVIKSDVQVTSRDQ